jgi:hypothetical protein
LLPNTNSPIEWISSGFEVVELVRQLQNPGVWNRYPVRLYGPHSKLSDCWVRYNAWENYDPQNPGAFNEPHEAAWYPVVNDIPAVVPLVFDVMREVEAEHLGGVLITKIPPHELCKPHKDAGWHAREHEKFAVQLQSNDKQAFCFEAKELRTKPGDLFTFDNSRLHWVVNDSDEPRMTLIISIRRSPCLGG